MNLLYSVVAPFTGGIYTKAQAEYFVRYDSYKTIISEELFIHLLSLLTPEKSDLKRGNYSIEVTKHFDWYLPTLEKNFLKTEKNTFEKAVLIFQKHIESLQKNGLKLNTFGDHSRELKTALGKSCPALLTALIETRAADVNSVTKQSLLARCHDNSCIDILIKYGCNPNAVNPQGESPLTNAIKYNRNIVLIKSLVSGKADVNLAAKDSCMNDEILTPLHIAAIRGKSIMITTLLELGADFFAVNSKNQTVADFAREIGDQYKVDANIIDDCIEKRIKEASEELQSIFPNPIISNLICDYLRIPVEISAPSKTQAHPKSILRNRFRILV